ncbi:MAG: pyruvate formate lyase family protein, partial [Planctomycetota bacterium]|nr:pyruvate formate lyase family protein [Planctomycetota bacterium]
MPRFRELPNYHSTSRVGRLRDRMNGDAHGVHRIPRPIDWSVSDLGCSLAERRGYSMAMACERMPISIEPDELIVGMRTLLDPAGEKAGVWHPPVPDFFRDESERESIDWGRSTSHNVPGFHKIVTSGLGELSARSEAKLETEADQVRRDTLKSYKIACDAAGTLFARYAALARELSGGVAGQRHADLEKIADACDHL